MEQYLSRALSSWGSVISLAVLALACLEAAVLAGRFEEDDGWQVSRGREEIGMPNQATSNETSSSNDAEMDWESYKQRFGKQFPNVESERRAERNWTKTRELLRAYASAPNASHPFKLAAKKFSDMSEGALLAQLVGFNAPKIPVGDDMVGTPRLAKHLRHAIKNMPTPRPPASFDIRGLGFGFSRRKFQGKCNIDWAFAATALIESKLDSGVSLSEQNLVDCAPGHLGANCRGSWNSYGALKLINDQKGIMRSADYPNDALEMGQHSQCRFRHKRAAVKHVDRVAANVGRNKEGETFLKRILNRHGAFATGMDAQPDFLHYSGGVYNGAGSGCGAQESDLNHEVVVVGYEEDEDGSTYFVAKNFWGPDWGVDGGFFKIRFYTCGFGSIVTLADPVND